MGYSKESVVGGLSKREIAEQFGEEPASLVIAGRDDFVLSSQISGMLSDVNLGIGADRVSGETVMYYNKKQVANSYLELAMNVNLWLQAGKELDEDELAVVGGAMNQLFSLLTREQQVGYVMRELTLDGVLMAA